MRMFEKKPESCEGADSGEMSVVDADMMHVCSHCQNLERMKAERSDQARGRGAGH